MDALEFRRLCLNFGFLHVKPSRAAAAAERSAARRARDGLRDEGGDADVDGDEEDDDILPPPEIFDEWLDLSASSPAASGANAPPSRPTGAGAAAAPLPPSTPPCAILTARSCGADAAGVTLMLNTKQVAGLE